MTKNKYCNNYNPNYNNYKGRDKNEAANFVSQCISVGGGQSLDGCEGLDDKGMITSIHQLKKCLISKKWRKTTAPLLGDPLFLLGSFQAMILTDYHDLYNTNFSSHEPDRCNGLVKYNIIEGYTL